MVGSWPNSLFGVEITAVLLFEDGGIRGHDVKAILARSKQRLKQAAVALWLLTSLDPAGLTAEPAHFWISTSNTTTNGPQAPTITGANGADQSLYIWAQPMTRNDGAYNSNTNPFKVLQNFSVNVATFQPTIDFLDDVFHPIVVYNPLVNNIPQFQYVNDSSNSGDTSPLKSDRIEQQVIGGSPDRIAGMQGFSISSSGWRGIGPSCLNDPLCTTTPSGVPAWLVASVSYRIVQLPAEIFLQIGYNGMNQLDQNGLPESSSLTSVVFGAGSTPVYMAG